jgi:hypothetical protein
MKPLFSMIDRRPEHPLGTSSSGTVIHRLLFQSLAFLLSATLPVNAADATPRAGAIREIAPCAFAHYSFGTAVDLEGHVLFTEFSHRKIQRWNPVTRRLDVWRGTDTPGMFGIAAGIGSDVFVGMDLGDTGNPGKILRIAGDGKEEYVVENITRPRQLTCDATGNLFAVLEGGRVLKWDKATRATTEVMTARSPVSGIAVGPDGSVFVSEYGVFDTSPTGYSRPSVPGQIKVKRPSGEIVVLNKGFWRVRGIALHGNSLYVCSEANREDHGNSGQLVKIDSTNGNEEILFNRLDYPQFPAASPDGKVYFTLGRDNCLVVYDPAALYHDAAIPAESGTRSSARGGSIAWGGSKEGTPFSITAQSVSLSGNFVPTAGASQMDGWIEIPANRFKLNPNDLYPIHDAEHPAPGLFELPKVETTSAAGRLHVEVFPLRRHEGSRWPMQNVGTASESPNAGFSEQPDAFRFYFTWSAPLVGEPDRKPLMIPRPSKPWKDALRLVGDGKTLHSDFNFIIDRNDRVHCMGCFGREPGSTSNGMAVEDGYALFHSVGDSLEAPMRPLPKIGYQIDSPQAIMWAPGMIWNRERTTAYLYYFHYFGGKDPAAGCARVLTSTDPDLAHWKPYSGTELAEKNMAFRELDDRDFCVFWDKRLETYLMYFCSGEGSGPRVRTSKDLIHWSPGRTVLKDTSASPHGYSESPCVIYRDGYYHLWTSGIDYSHTHLYISEDPFNFGETLANAIETQPGHAVEIITHRGKEYIAGSMLSTVPSATPAGHDLEGIFVQPLKWEAADAGMDSRVTRKP